MKGFDWLLRYWPWPRLCFPEARMLVLGRKDTPAEADWLFNQPTDIAFGPKGEVYAADGDGNSRVAKFDRDCGFLKAWGKYGSGAGEFNLPHSIVADRKGKVYIGFPMACS